MKHIVWMMNSFELLVAVFPHRAMPIQCPVEQTSHSCSTQEKLQYGLLSTVKSSSSLNYGTCTLNNAKGCVSMFPNMHVSLFLRGAHCI